MTEQTIPADKVREILATRGLWAIDMIAEIEALLPPPPLPTLADMTLDEQDECTGMQADLAQGDRVVILDGTPDAAGLVQVLEKSLDVYRAYPKEVTPRPDLPRMGWPGDKESAPAMPDGWRLADHPDHGRVVVTRPTQDSEGNVLFVVPSTGHLGHKWRSCKPDELTYLDADKEADTSGTVPESTLAVGSVWGDADALTRACEETGRDHIAVTDRDGGVSVWDARRDDWRGHYRAVPKYAPYTIIHTGQEADQ